MMHAWLRGEQIRILRGMWELPSPPVTPRAVSSESAAPAGHAGPAPGAGAGAAPGTEPRADIPPRPMPARPPGARPHRWEEEEPAPPPVPRPHPSDSPLYSLLVLTWCAGVAALIGVLWSAEELVHGGDPQAWAMLYAAAMSVVVLIPAVAWSVERKCGVD